MIMHALLLMAILSGTVTSSDGHVLPGVTVTAGDKTTVTNMLGAYRFDNLTAGTHELKFELSGLKTVKMTVPITETGNTLANVQMKYAIIDCPMIYEPAPMIDTHSSMTGIHLTAFEMQKLPLR